MSHGAGLEARISPPPRAREFDSNHRWADDPCLGCIVRLVLLPGFLDMDKGSLLIDRDLIPAAVPWAPDSLFVGQCPNEPDGRSEW